MASKRIADRYDHICRRARWKPLESREKRKLIPALRVLAFES